MFYTPSTATLTPLFRRRLFDEISKTAIDFLIDILLARAPVGRPPSAIYRGSFVVDRPVSSVSKLKNTVSAVLSRI